MNFKKNVILTFSLMALIPNTTTPFFLDDSGPIGTGLVGATVGGIAGGGRGAGIGLGVGLGLGLLNRGHRGYYEYRDYDYNETGRLQEEFNGIVEKYNDLLDYTKELERKAEELNITGPINKSDRYNYYKKDYRRYEHPQLQREFRQLVDEYNDLLDYAKELEEKVENLQS